VKSGVESVVTDPIVKPRVRKTQVQISSGINSGTEDLYEMPGLVVAYPLSQYILRRVCSIHMRGQCTLKQYEASKCKRLRGGGWLWLIEGHASSRNLPKSHLHEILLSLPADVTNNIPGRPEHAQIIGAVRFADEVQ
jgi:hypothetical protein